MTHKETILKVLVGSRAHGLHTPDSDYDFRGVYVLPTAEILSLGHNYKGSSWLEGAEDNTSYEIGHFLFLATKANPSILEVLVSAEIAEASPLGQEMRTLLPYVYEPRAAFAAFTGYSYNQRKKMLDGKDSRPLKYATAYLRTLYNLCDLLETGTFSLKVEREDRRKTLLSIKHGELSVGLIIDLCDEQTRRAQALLCDAKNTQDLTRVNDFLLRVRKAYF